MAHIADELLRPAHPGRWRSRLSTGLTSTSTALANAPENAAYGLMALAPLGPTFGPAAMALALLGAVVASSVASLLGGGQLVGGARASLSLLTAGLVAALLVQLDLHGADAAAPVLFLVAFGVACAGVLQFLFGLLKLGTLVKFTPHPVRIGVTSGVGLLLMITALPVIIGHRPMCSNRKAAGSHCSNSTGRCSSAPPTAFVFEVAEEWSRGGKHLNFAEWDLHDARRRVIETVATPDTVGLLRFFDNTDMALEDAEDRLLERMQAGGDAGRPLALADTMIGRSLNVDELALLSAEMRTRQFARGQVRMLTGDLARWVSRAAAGRTAATATAERRHSGTAEETEEGIATLTARLRAGGEGSLSAAELVAHPFRRSNSSSL